MYSAGLKSMGFVGCKHRGQIYIKTICAIFHDKFGGDDFICFQATLYFFFFANFNNQLLILCSKRVF